MPRPAATTTAATLERVTRGLQAARKSLVYGAKMLGRLYTYCTKHGWDNSAAKSITGLIEELSVADVGAEHALHPPTLDPRYVGPASGGTAGGAA